METLTICGTLWKYEGQAAWYFLSTTAEQGSVLKEGRRRIGWGSIPVRVTIGASTWDTSIFPTKEGPFLLPIKAAVRKKESLTEGTAIEAVCVPR